MIAAKAGAAECVQVLLEAGAAVDATAAPSAAFVAEIEKLQARISRRSPTDLHVMRYRHVVSV